MLYICLATDRFPFSFVIREPSLLRAGEGVDDFFNAKQHKSITPPLAESNFLLPLLEVVEKIRNPSFKQKHF